MDIGLELGQRVDAGWVGRKLGRTKVGLDVSLSGLASTKMLGMGIIFVCFLLLFFVFIQ